MRAVAHPRWEPLHGVPWHETKKRESNNQTSHAPPAACPAPTEAYASTTLTTKHEAQRARRPAGDAADRGVSSGVPRHRHSLRHHPSAVRSSRPRRRVLAAAAPSAAMRPDANIHARRVARGIAPPPPRHRRRRNPPLPPAAAAGSDTETRGGGRRGEPITRARHHRPPPRSASPRARRRQPQRRRWHPPPLRPPPKPTGRPRRLAAPMPPCGRPPSRPTTPHRGRRAVPRPPPWLACRGRCPTGAALPPAGRRLRPPYASHHPQGRVPGAVEERVKHRKKKRNKKRRGAAKRIGTCRQYSHPYIPPAAPAKKKKTQKAVLVSPRTHSAPPPHPKANGGVEGRGRVPPRPRRHQHRARVAHGGGHPSGGGATRPADCGDRNRRRHTANGGVGRRRWPPPTNEPAAARAGAPTRSPPAPAAIPPPPARSTPGHGERPGGGRTAARQSYPPCRPPTHIRLRLRRPGAAARRGARHPGRGAADAAARPPPIEGAAGQPAGQRPSMGHRVATPPGMGCAPHPHLSTPVPPSS